MATLREIAREAGVSVSVASRVLNKDATLRTRPATRQRVEDAAQKLAYQPNHGGRSLRLARTAAIAFVVPEINNAIFTEVIRGVEDGADELGLDVLLGSGRRLDPASGFLNRLGAQRRVDGFLIQPRDTDDPSKPGPLVTGTNSPAVWLNTFRPNGSVYLDNAPAAGLATQHLVELGHTAIGLVGGREASYTGREREAGFRAALQGAGIDPNPNWITTEGYSAVEGARAARTLLTARSRPTALVVANVNAGLGVLRAAHDLDVAVPDQLSVVALHDVWFAEYSTPELTVVRMPLYNMGYHGIRDLHRQMGGEEPTARRIVEPPPELVIRRSTTPLG